MAQVKKSVLVHFSAQQMYNLVRDVLSYPEFLPWCGGSQVQHEDDRTDVASVDIVFKGLKHRFTTRNQLTPDESIEMALIDGPFKALQGQWGFVALSDDACKVTFDLEYEFSSRLLEKLIGPVFHYIADTFVDGFVQRAEALDAQGKL